LPQLANVARAYEGGQGCFDEAPCKLVHAPDPDRGVVGNCSSNETA
jgi:hypothetical protein